MMNVKGFGLLAVMIWHPSTVKLFCFSPDSPSTDSIVLKPEKPPSEKRTKYLFLHVWMYSPLLCSHPFFTTLTRNIFGRIQNIRRDQKLDSIAVSLFSNTNPNYSETGKLVYQKLPLSAGFSSPYLAHLLFHFCTVGNGQITINIKLDNGRHLGRTPHLKVVFISSLHLAAQSATFKMFGGWISPAKGYIKLAD